MEIVDFLFNFIIEYREYSYITVFAILIACGFGLPVSKDGMMIASGIVAGVLSETDPFALYTMLLVCLIGVVLGDTIMFCGGRLLSYRIQKVWPFSRYLTPKKFVELRKSFKKYGVGLICIARFVPFIRAPLYIFCGITRKISYLKFVIVNTIATSVYTFLWTGLGYVCAHERHKIAQIVSQINHTLILSILILSLIILLLIRFRIHKKLTDIK